MKAIIYIKDADKNGKLDLKTCSIYNNEIESNSWNDTTQRLSHLTEKGYYSQKPLYVDFATLERVECNGNNKWIVLTDLEYDYLKNNYTQQGKIFQTYEQRKRTEKACADLAWCSVMKDPYDVG
jgi:hypothetical protein